MFLHLQGWLKFLFKDWILHCNWKMKFWRTLCSHIRMIPWLTLYNCTNSIRSLTISGSTIKKSRNISPVPYKSTWPFLAKRLIRPGYMLPPGKCFGLFAAIMPPKPAKTWNNNIFNVTSWFGLTKADSVILGHNYHVPSWPG